MNHADEFLFLLNDPARKNDIAVRAAEEELTYGELDLLVRAHAERIAFHRVRVLASLMSNGAEWIINDLACLKAGVVHVPLPLFFTPQQWRHTLKTAGVDSVLSPPSMQAMLGSFDFEHIDTFSETLALFRQPAQISLPADTAKITFTSGSTGSPKGVCLGARAMLAVAGSVANATQTLRIRRHLTTLPLPILLENIAGVYVPLIQGAAITTTSPGKTGLQGSSCFDPAQFHATLTDTGAQSVIVLPQMLRAYSAWVRATGARVPTEIRYAAVGGAAVGAQLLMDARAQGIPAYVGYGLSEACSVQTLNLPGADCPGSAGRPLPHTQLRIAADGEIEVAGSHALGYLGEPFACRHWLPTGDLGYLDEAGFLHIQGRKKNVLVTGFGRNVSPEWIELRLTGFAPIAHAVVLGEGEPALGAVIWPRGEVNDETIEACVARVNQALPDYARLGRWTRARGEFSAATGLATANGRPCRQAIAGLHADLFSAISAQPFL